MGKPTQKFTFRLVPNDGSHPGDEEPYQGYWAYPNEDYIIMMYEGGYGALGDDKGPYPTRGHGNTVLEAIACLCACKEEEHYEPGMPVWSTREAMIAFVGSAPAPQEDPWIKYDNASHPDECSCYVCTYGLDTYIHQFHPGEY